MGSLKLGFTEVPCLVARRFFLAKVAGGSVSAAYLKEESRTETVCVTVVTVLTVGTGRVVVSVVVMTMEVVAVSVEVGPVVVRE